MRRNFRTETQEVLERAHKIGSPRSTGNEGRWTLVGRWLATGAAVTFAVLGFESTKPAAAYPPGHPGSSQSEPETDDESDTDDESGDGPEAADEPDNSGGGNWGSDSDTHLVSDDRDADDDWFSDDSDWEDDGGWFDDEPEEDIQTSFGGSTDADAEANDEILGLSASDRDIAPETNDGFATAVVDSPTLPEQLTQDPVADMRYHHDQQRREFATSDVAAEELAEQWEALSSRQESELEQLEARVPRDILGQPYYTDELADEATEVALHEQLELIAGHRANAEAEGAFEGLDGKTYTSAERAEEANDRRAEANGGWHLDWEGNRFATVGEARRSNDRPWAIAAVNDPPIVTGELLAIIPVIDLAAGTSQAVTGLVEGNPAVAMAGMAALLPGPSPARFVPDSITTSADDVLENLAKKGPTVSKVPDSSAAAANTGSADLDPPTASLAALGVASVSLVSSSVEDSDDLNDEPLAEIVTKSAELPTIEPGQPNVPNQLPPKAPVEFPNPVQLPNAEPGPFVLPGGEPIGDPDPSAPPTVDPSTDPIPTQPPPNEPEFFPGPLSPPEVSPSFDQPPVQFPRFPSSPSETPIVDPLISWPFQLPGWEPQDNPDGFDVVQPGESPTLPSKVADDPYVVNATGNDDGPSNDDNGDEADTGTEIQSQEVEPLSVEEAEERLKVAEEAYRTLTRTISQQSKGAEESQTGGNAISLGDTGGVAKVVDDRKQAQNELERAKRANDAQIELDAAEEAYATAFRDNSRFLEGSPEEPTGELGISPGEAVRRIDRARDDRDAAWTRLREINQGLESGKLGIDDRPSQEDASNVVNIKDLKVQQTSPRESKATEQPTEESLAERAANILDEFKDRLKAQEMDAKASKATEQTTDESHTDQASRPSNEDASSADREKLISLYELAVQDLDDARAKEALGRADVGEYEAQRGSLSIDQMKLDTASRVEDVETMGRQLEDLGIPLPRQPVAPTRFQTDDRTSEIADQASETAKRVKAESDAIGDRALAEAAAGVVYSAEKVQELSQRASQIEGQIEESENLETTSEDLAQARQAMVLLDDLNRVNYDLAYWAGVLDHRQWAFGKQSSQTTTPSGDPALDHATELARQRNIERQRVTDQQDRLLDETAQMKDQVDPLDPETGPAALRATLNADALRASIFEHRFANQHDLEELKNKATRARLRADNLSDPELQEEVDRLEHETEQVEVHQADVQSRLAQAERDFATARQLYDLASSDLELRVLNRNHADSNSAIISDQAKLKVEVDELNEQITDARDAGDTAAVQRFSDAVEDLQEALEEQKLANLENTSYRLFEADQMEAIGTATSDEELAGQAQVIRDDAAEVKRQQLAAATRVENARTTYRIARAVLKQELSR